MSMERFRTISDKEKQVIKEEVKGTPYAFVSPEIGDKEIVIDQILLAAPVWLWKLIYRAAEHQGSSPDEIISSAFAELMPVLLDSWRVPEVTTVQ